MELVHFYCVSVCGDDWVKYERTCYHHYEGPLPYEDAQSKCEEEGSNLVIIKSEEENDMIA